MDLKQIPKQVIAGIVVVLTVTVIALWELLKALLGELGAFVSLFLTAVALIYALKYTGVI